MSAIVPVVEGDGEIEAVPLLLRRVLAERCSRHDLDVARPKSAHGRDTLLRDFERYLRYAAGTSGCCAVLVLLDADNDCAKKRALGLAKKTRGLGLSIPVAIVCAKRQYETWFVASLDTIKGRTLKGRQGISSSAQFAGSAEDLKGAKGWLTSNMPRGRAYKETMDQVPLTEYIDLNLACANSRSFRRLCHAVEELVQAMDTGIVIVTPQGA